MSCKATGIVNGASGIWSAAPETLVIVTVSPLSIVSTGFSEASK